MEQTTKPCRECKSTIPAAASLCKECKSYQDWRSYLSFSSTVLALIVALIAVAGATLPIIVGAIGPKRSNVHVAILGDDRSGGLLFLMTNDGNRPGGVRSVYLGASLGGTASIVSNGELDLENSDAVIEPGAMKQLRVIFPTAQEFSNHTIFEIDGKCLFKVRTYEFDGGYKDHEFEEICDSYPTVIPLKAPK